MRYSLLFFLVIVLTSCATIKRDHVPEEIDSTNVWNEAQCKDVPPIWWGKKGEDPSKTSMWKCYNWIIADENMYGQ